MAAALHVGQSPIVSLPELAQAVERGQLSISQAVDQLVDSALGGAAEALTEFERAELSELLRLAVASDPALRALQDEQG